MVFRCPLVTRSLAEPKVLLSAGSARPVTQAAEKRAGLRAVPVVQITVLASRLLPA